MTLIALSALLGTAHAMDCPTDDALCTTVASAIDEVNAQLGAPVLDEAAPKRLQPATLLAHLRGAAASIEAQGCGFDEEDLRWGAGIYDRHAFDGAIGGPDGLEGGMPGSIDRSRKEVAGAWASEDFGGTFGRYDHQGRVFASIADDGRFYAGRWARIQGIHGVYIGIEGQCAGNAARGLDAWTGGQLADLAVEPEPEAPVGPLHSWIPIQSPDAFSFFDDDRVEVAGAGERRAFIDMPDVSQATIHVDGATHTTGSGWGIVVHGAYDAVTGHYDGYTIQLDTGLGGRVVVRERIGNGERSPFAQTEPGLEFHDRAVDVTVELDGPALRVALDGVPVLDVPDLRVATGRPDAPISGAVGLRLWSTTDLTIDRFVVAAE